MRVSVAWIDFDGSLEFSIGNCPVPLVPSRGKRDPGRRDPPQPRDRLIRPVRELRAPRRAFPGTGARIMKSGVEGPIDAPIAVECFLDGIAGGDQVQVLGIPEG